VDIASQFAREDYWYPLELPEDKLANGGSGGGVVDKCVYDNLYPTEYLNENIQHLVLFNSEEECCTPYHCLSSTYVKEHKWYPKLVDNTPSCVYGNDYDASYTHNVEYAASFLFESEVECCGGFPVACPGMAWYYTTTDATDGEGTECVFGDVTTATSVVQIFMSEEECLAHVGGAGGETTTTVAATTTAEEEVVEITTTGATVQADLTTDATTTTTIDPCTNCKWHESHTQINTCTNSLDYPISFEHARPYLFFHTAEECCNDRFKDDCIIEDVGTPNSNAQHEFMDLTGVDRLTDDFEAGTLNIPFDLGPQDSPQWELTSTKAHRGSWSLRNIPANGPSATSDLILRVSIPQDSNGYKLSCMANIRVSMPWEYFALFVNGQQRNTYHQPVGPTEDYWFGLITGLGPGENTVMFRVKNGDVNTEAYGISRDETWQKGDGRVYLDDCYIYDVSSL
jgi:hypothetical protein